MNPGDHPELRFDSRGMGCLCGPGVSPILVATLLSKEVLAEGVRRFLYDNGSRHIGSSLAPHISPPLYEELRLDDSVMAVGVKVWPLPWYAPGLRNWWVLGCFVHVLFKHTSPGDSGRLMLNRWAMWQKWCELFCAPALCMRKALDRRGLDRDWSRFLPEHTCSTFGLLVFSWVQQLTPTWVLGVTSCMPSADFLIGPWTLKVSSSACLWTGNLQRHVCGQVWWCTGASVPLFLWKAHMSLWPLSSSKQKDL